MNFTAIAVETANANLASICQIGVVAFKDGVPDLSWQSFVDPEDYFDGMNVSIHGIDEESVEGAPTFPQIRDLVVERLSGQIVVSHTSVDRVVYARALKKYELAETQCTWLDTAKVVRRAWTELSGRGYGLRDVAAKLGIKLVHHNAQERARAAGEILVHAIKSTGFSVEEWLARVERPINPSHVSKDANPEGPLIGEVIVFTGALTIPRNQAAGLAAVAGCRVTPSVTKATTLLVVGDQDLRRLEGHEKSSKHRKAEELIRRGQHIRILGESDFRHLIDLAS